jgi:TolB-like protein
MQRHVLFRVATGYFVIAWLVIQVGDVLFENFAAPDWLFRALVGVLVAGFPVALVLAWIVDGQRRRSRAAAGEETRRLGPGLQLASALVLLSMAVGLGFLGWRAVQSVPDGRVASSEPSIAVLPFSDMSAAGDQRYFAHGLSEEILNLLAGVAELKVSGRTSSFSFEDKDASIPEIGAALDVAHVLEGSVRKSGSQVRVTAQLISTADGFHVWSENFERELTDIFAIQDDIASAIASTLQVQLIDGGASRADATSTSSIEAYELFLRARPLIQDRALAGIERASELLDTALELDPDFAPALAQSALADLMLANTSITPGSAPLAQAIAAAEPKLQRARELSPGLADSYAVAGLMHLLRNETEAAERALAMALDRNASHTDALNWQAINLRRAARIQEELQARQRLAQIDPFYLSNAFNLAIVHILHGDLSAARAAVAQMKDDFPGSPWAEVAEIEVEFRFGRIASAYRRGQAALDDGNGAVTNTLGSILLAIGEPERAVELTGATFSMALIAQGQIDEAVALAQQEAAAAPNDRNTAQALLRVLGLAGQHEVLLTYFENRWGSLDAFHQFFRHGDNSAEIIPVAVAQQALGRDEALEQTLTAWSGWLDHLEDEGFGLPYYYFIAASHAALSGHRDEAFSQLRAAIDRGYLIAELPNEPQFHSLQDDPEFQALLELNRQRINAERAELDLPPLDAQRAGKDG